MSIISDEMKINIEKYNSDTEIIVNEVMNILAGKNHSAGIECLSLILVSLIDGLNGKEIKIAVINRLINNLNKYLSEM